MKRRKLYVIVSLIALFLLSSCMNGNIHALPGGSSETSGVCYSTEDTHTIASITETQSPEVFSTDIMQTTAEHSSSLQPSEEVFSDATEIPETVPGITEPAVTGSELPESSMPSYTRKTAG